MIELKRSNFWARNRVAVGALLFSTLLAILIGCGGGGGGGGTSGGGGTGGNPPAAPTNLAAAAGNGQITLTWTASSGATSYNIKRGTTSGGPYTTIRNAVTNTSFTDTGLVNGNAYYYVVTASNAAGESGSSNQATATPTSGGGGGPSWLPANKIFYTVADSADPSVTDIREVNPNGTSDISFQSAPAQFEAISPNPNVNGQLFFAYTTSTNPGSDPNATYAIYRNNTVSLTNAVQITDPSTLALTNVGSIQFTPDGQRVIFTGAIGSDHGLYVMNLNGTGRTRLVSADDASLSPDGSKILYSQSQGAENDIFYIGINETSGHALVTTTDTDEIMPQWSKDGTKITYAAKPSASLTAPYDVYVRAFSGGSSVRVTANGDNNLSPSFSPDGSQVAYARLSSANVATSGVYKVSVSGGSEANIVLNPAIETGLYWTSSTGRSVGGAAVNMGRTLKKLTFINRP